MIELMVGERQFVRVKAVHRRSGQPLEIQTGGRGRGQDRTTHGQDQQRQNLAAPDRRVRGPHADLAEQAGGVHQQPSGSPGAQGAENDPSAPRWEATNPSIVSVVAAGDGAWVMGLAPGQATVEVVIPDLDLGDGDQTERASIGVTVTAQPRRAGLWLEPGAPVA